MTTAKLSPERKEEIRELYREQHGQGWYRTVISELLAHIAEVEGQLGGSKDLWDEVAIVLDEAGIPASERSPEGSPCYIATSNRVKELCAELAKVRQELEAVIAVKDSYKYRGDAAEAALRSRDEELDEAVKMLRVLNEETVLAGLPGGDRNQTLANVRKLRSRDEAVRELLKTSQALLSTMETCHICKGALMLEESPVHCEDCSFDCEGHEEPECIPIYVLHAQLRAAAERLEKIVGGKSNG